MPNLGPAELILILAVALIVFGPKKLPEIGKGIGNALREFNKARNDLMDSLNSEVHREEPSYRQETAPSYAAALDAPAAERPAPEGTAARPAYSVSHETESADALPYGSDFHAVEGDSQPSFRTAQPENAPVATAANSHSNAGHSSDGKA